MPREGSRQGRGRLGWVIMPWGGSRREGFMPWGGDHAKGGVNSWEKVARVLRGSTGTMGSCQRALGAVSKPVKEGSNAHMGCLGAGRGVRGIQRWGVNT